MSRSPWPIAIVALALCLGPLAGCGGGEGASSGSAASTEPARPSAAAGGTAKTKPTVNLPKRTASNKVVYNDIEAGSGAEAKDGDRVTLNYVGVSFETGEEFDASWDRGEPITFTLGAGEVIPGWDAGIVGMKKGGRRKLVVPPRYAYGEAGFPPAVGPNETLVFVIDLEGVG